MMRTFAKKLKSDWQSGLQGIHEKWLTKGSLVYAAV